MDAAAKRRVSKIGQQLDENDRQGLCWGGVGGGWLKVGGGNGEAWLGGGPGQKLARNRGNGR